MRALAGMGLLSAAALVSQVALVRVFSIAQFYHFAFLVISLALLGFGASGSLMSTSRSRSRRVASLSANSRSTLEGIGKDGVSAGDGGGALPVAGGVAVAAGVPPIGGDPVGISPVAGAVVVRGVAAGGVPGTGLPSGRELGLADVPQPAAERIASIMTAVVRLIG
ncbi:MAG TPA: hypothetical protein VLS28_04805 [Candidatus Sulfomarinibacteraceae bacterium]|nr:hypothetical protein [Candidatus Sulfomarinibacteraceae bacterium]